MSQEKTYIQVPSGEKNGEYIDLVPTVSVQGHSYDPEKKEEKTKVKSTGFFKLFRFADGIDRLLLAIGFFCLVINAAMYPIMMIVFGDMIEAFVDAGRLKHYLEGITDYLTFVNSTQQDIIENPQLLECGPIQTFYSGNISCFENHQDRLFDMMVEFAIFYCVLGGIVLIVNYGQMTCWMTSAERQARRIRHVCLLNILRQDIGWFDTHKASEVNTKLGDGVIKIQEGIGSKASLFFQWTFCALFNLGVSLYYGWQQTLVILSTFVASSVVVFLLNKVIGTISQNEMMAYGKAGAVAEEVLGAIRTVVAFGGQEKDIERYKKNLTSAKSQGIKKGLMNGLSLGFSWGSMYASFGLSLWYGARLYRTDEDYAIQNVITVVNTSVFVAFSLGNAMPNVQVIATARGAAAIIFGLIDSESEIDSLSEEGLKPKSLTGTIKFENVHFRYPGRSDVKILNGLSFEAKQGQTVALVGGSGCGKTTGVELLLRFYDPQKGKVLIHGQDVKELNISWLRQNISLVSQEPVLFHTTIAENIRYGKEDVTMEEIIKATQDANAYDFIMALPDKFETMVGERGSQLSGGQKQRLAIARALARDPKILLLDEATSALDTESESIVQDALDKARKGRTTIVIAHRLSTIRSADLIIGINNGQVAEMGTHGELMDKQGIYYQLVTNQQANHSEKDPTVALEIDIGDITKEKTIQLNSFMDSEIESEAVDTEQEIEGLPSAPFTRILKLNATEWPFILLGCLGSMLHGAAMPLFAVAFSQVIKYISEEDEEEQKEKILFSTLLFLVMGVLMFIAIFFQNYMFSLSGEALTARLRDMCFQSLLRQEMLYFDDKNNSVGALTTRLNTDASRVKSMGGPRLGAVLMSITCLIITLVIVFIYGWKMALVIFAFMPFMILSGIMMMGLTSGQTKKSKQALEDAGKVTAESISNIRTVASLNKESKFVTMYLDSLKGPYTDALKSCHLVALVYAFSQSINYFAFAASFLFGGYMVEQQEMTFDDVFLVFFAIIMGGIELGSGLTAAPDAGKAMLSARRVMQLIDAKPSLDYTSTEGKTLVDNNNACVSFKNVDFHYPNRKSVKVLQGMSFTVSPGQTVALVGSSGCGKSTSVQLLERFYDCDDGQVVFDHHDIKDLNIRWLRQQLGIVFQEPLLFDTSIAENIAYGDNTRIVKMDEIIDAARCANIHSFIASLPDGYDTNVGSKGVQLSGGEKQRIAIARALIRNPKIFLLDEATSALDTENEKIVQAALDKAIQGRSCIVIAHRLSTVQNADKICVIRQGKVSECGTHSELMSKQGYYSMLVKKSQGGDKTS